MKILFIIIETISFSSLLLSQITKNERVIDKEINELVYLVYLFFLYLVISWIIKKIKRK